MLACATLGFACSAAAAAAASASGASARYLPGEIVVGYEDGRDEVLKVPAGRDLGDLIRRRQQRPGVEYAVRNYVATAALEPVDGGTGQLPGGWKADQWNFLGAPGGVRAPAAWDRLVNAGAPGGRGVTVAVVDTGIAYASTEQGGPAAPDFAPDQFVNGIDLIDDDLRPLDENGHGTHVAATIGEQISLGKPTGEEDFLTGLAYGAKLMPVRVLDAAGAGAATDVAEGITWAARNGAEVINLSLQFDEAISGCEQVPTVCSAIRKASRRGALVVAAAGNALSGAGKPGALYPAAAPKAVGVGATTEHGCLADYSYFGKRVDLVAPGGGSARAEANSVLCRDDIRPVLALTLTCFPDPCSLDSYGKFEIRADTGTSMASAHASAAAALVIASRVIGNDPSPKQVAKRLACTARKATPRRFYRAGALDALRAVRPKLHCK